MSFILTEDYQELIEDIVRDGRLYASENHQEILKVSSCLSTQEVSMSSHIRLPDIDFMGSKVSSIIPHDLILLNIKFLSLVFYIYKL
jgi:hypothetical protein